jgi:hypothetical protein
MLAQNAASPRAGDAASATGTQPADAVRFEACSAASDALRTLLTAEASVESTQCS